MVDINEVAENIYLIDNRLFSIPKWGSTYLLNEEKKALIDPGPAASAGVILDGIREIELPVFTGFSAYQLLGKSRHREGRLVSNRKILTIWLLATSTWTMPAVPVFFLRICPRRR